MDQAFTIYRPPKTTGRLEGTYYVAPENTWRPSISYNYTISDIRNQFTPAENYRNALQTSGKLIRLIQRLELRWGRNFKAFTNAALRVQALHRGNVGRAFFKTVKEKLMIELKQRQAKLNASAFFRKNNFEEAVAEVDRNLPGSVELLVIKMKSQYRLAHYMNCIDTTEQVIGKLILYALFFCAGGSN